MYIDYLNDIIYVYYIHNDVMRYVFFYHIYIYNIPCNRLH